MNKLDFLRRLDKHLSVLDKEERREILAFYEERFYTGTIYENKTEEEVIADLESPETIAKNVLAEYGVSPTYVKTKEERYSNVSTTRVILLIAFDVIVATWIIPTLFSVAVSILGSSFSWFGTLPLLFGERTAVDEFVFVFLSSAYVLYFLFGLVVLGAAVFVTKTIIIWHLNTFKIKGREKWIKRFSRYSLDGWFKRHPFWAKLKNLALVASLVGIVYTGIWIFNHYDWVEAEYGAGEIQVETITEDFSAEILAGGEWTIDTNFESMDIQVVLTDGDEVTVVHKYYEDDEFTYDFDYENNVLTMTSELDNQYFWGISSIFRIFTENYSVRIEVPSTLVLDNATLVTLNGEVEIRNVDFDTIDITTSNGSIEISDINMVDDLTVYTSNGSILIKDVTVATDGTLDAETSNGSIDVTNTNFHNYYLDTSNGSIELENLNVTLQDGLVLVAETSNGKIDLENVYVDDITLDTSNGDINYFNDDTTFIPSSVEEDSTNGDFSTNVR